MTVNPQTTADLVNNVTLLCTGIIALVAIGVVFTLFSHNQSATARINVCVIGALIIAGAVFVLHGAHTGAMFK